MGNVEFYMMNKDIKVAKFICSSGAYSQVYIEGVYRYDLLPLSIRSGVLFSDWLSSRLVLSHRKNVLEMFKKLGVTTQEDILSITLGISLNDTFWVKPISSRRKWASVSPYSNPLNKDVANYSFGSDDVDGKSITHSPDFATSGQFPKCWKRINGVVYLIKGGSKGHSLAGNEPYSEVHAYILAKRLGLNCVRYDYLKYRGLNATMCENMCSESLGIVPLSEVNRGIISYQDVLDFVSRDTDKKAVLDMLLLDYLTLNIDRHFGNISFFINNDTQTLLGVAPIYDNNLSLLPTYSPEYDKTIERYIENYGGFVARTGMSFEDLFRMIDCSYIREKLTRLRGYRIESDLKRVDVANEVLKRQLSLVPCRR